MARKRREDPQDKARRLRKEISHKHALKIQERLIEAGWSVEALQRQVADHGESWAVRAQFDSLVVAFFTCNSYIDSIEGEKRFELGDPFFFGVDDYEIAYEMELSAGPRFWTPGYWIEQYNEASKSADSDPSEQGVYGRNQ